jgi:hydrophobic/amphiphilic exporter-1 (mainly G- bacteria), HAE1 family
MTLIRLAVDRPIAVLALVSMVVMFGAVALQTIPIQLAPDINKPVIGIRTSWPGASPQEVEREILIRQEEVLQSVEGLDRMTGEAMDGSAHITLEFDVDQDMQKALLLVANRLDQVTGYPDEADEPRIDTAGSDDQPIAWFTLRTLPGNDRPINTYGDFVDDVIRDRLERVQGVSRVNVFGGSARELTVIVDPERMARYGLTVPDVVRTLRAANASITAGDVEEGKRRYVVRSEGELINPERVENILLRSVLDPSTGRLARASVKDIAEVRFEYKEPLANIRRLGAPAMALNVIRETGANVIETMAGIRAAVDDLNAGALASAGLALTQTYDETTYITDAIALVQSNIWAGGLLAAIVLWLFLRSLSATLIIAIAIPVSLIGAFIAMAALGRSINVISLAGLAFSVGMVVDAAIVVLENIHRLRGQGMPAAIAAYTGAEQVWAAVMAGALTTVVVFVPLLLLKLEVGQLFRDLAVALSVAIVLSLVVSITVVPALAAWLARRSTGPAVARRLPVVDRGAEQFVNACMALTRLTVARRTAGLGLVALICGATGLATWLFLPKLEYLPEGNRNLVAGAVLPPPGYNLASTTAIAQDIEAAVRPLWASETGPTAEPGQPPKIDHFFFVARRNTASVGASAIDPERVSELIPVLQAQVFKDPGTYGFIAQPSIFGRSVGSGRLIEVNVSGPDLEQVFDVARRAAAKIEAQLPRAAGNQLRPKPGLELGAPQIRLYPDPLRLADNGLSARDFGETIDAFNDGLRIAEITVDGRRIDLMLAGPQHQITQTQGIGQIPVVTQSGRIIPARSLADITLTSGPTEIRHLERERTVTIEVRPAAQLPLETAIETLQTGVIDALFEEGVPPGTRIALAGTADALTKTWRAMLWQIVLAIAVVYLLMAMLFESFLFPLIIVLSVPLATAGGVGGLLLLNAFLYQPLDMLTLLGFVILVGTVVNNAILLVHQSLHRLRVDGMAPQDAIVSATRDRIRPIFMSTMTSVFGMLPLVLFPGAGSELYRGLGAVVLGGLSLSAVLTLAIIPPLLAMVMPVSERGRRPLAPPSGAGARRG